MGFAFPLASKPRASSPSPDNIISMAFCHACSSSSLLILPGGPESPGGMELSVDAPLGPAVDFVPFSSAIRPGGLSPANCRSKDSMPSTSDASKSSSSTAAPLLDEPISVLTFCGAAGLDA